MKKSISILICVLSIFTTAAFGKTASFTEGKEYVRITPSSSENLNLSGSSKILVTEFFNYGCPACYHIEPEVIHWLSKKPKNIDFDRVPLLFHSEWKIFSKAYYTAKSLEMFPKIHEALFKAVHEERQSFNTDEEMETFFIKHGIKKEDFESVFAFSPGIEAQIQKSQDLMNAYKIFEIPTFIVNGNYKTNLRMVNGNTKMLFDVLNFLITKEKIRS